MLRIKSICITNFRAIEYAEVTLDPYLTVLVGDNATGKTAILDAIAAALSFVIEGGDRRFSRSIAAKDFRVVGLSNPMGEVHRSDSMKLTVNEFSGNDWECFFNLDIDARRQVVRGDSTSSGSHNYRAMLKDDRFIAPIIASYGADRASPLPRSHLESSYAKRRSISFGRSSGYIGALDGRAAYEEAVDWFEAIDSLELRNNREAVGVYRDSRLDAVRKAISQLVPEISNPRMVGLPPRLMLDVNLPGRPVDSLSVEQLSGGYRAMLALVIDISRRMADLNPDLPEPLKAEGVVLIDEIDLHLHPRWQQLVVNGLRTVFPNVQFILTTHSPQVLTTISSKNILNLKWVGGMLIRDDIPSTSGAESGRLMSEVMGVDERPPAEVSNFVTFLDEYRNLVALGRSNTPEAAGLLQRLRLTSPDDPILGVLELEQRRLAAQMRRSSGEI